MKYITEDQSWVKFYPKFNSGFYLCAAGYFDERPEIITSVTQVAMLIALPILAAFSLWWLLLFPLLFFGWGRVYICLPIKTGIQDCESAAWGINYHNDTLWIYTGGGLNMSGGKRSIAIDMPWSLVWVRTSTLLDSPPAYPTAWHHETKANRKAWSGGGIGSYDWLERNKQKYSASFIDKRDGTQLSALVSVSEREWRMIWLKWTPMFAKVVRQIDVSFSAEVGNGKGSWKGGTVGCGYELRPGEHPLTCLKRMELEREF